MSVGNSIIADLLEIWVNWLKEKSGVVWKSALPAEAIIE